MTAKTTDETGTARLAAALGRTLLPGDVVALYGDLGAGKTAFVRGLATGLGLDPALVHSPTFALVNKYQGAERTLCHFDMYRAGDAETLEAAGFYDAIERGCVLAVEWSERVAGYLPAGCVGVTISRGREENERVITIEGGRDFDDPGR